MSKESFDIDSLTEMENEFVDLHEEAREKKTKQKKEKAQKKLENKRSIGNIMMTSVLPAVVVSVIAYGAGIFTAPSNNSEVTTIKQIKHESSLSSRVDTLKDSELQALQSQLKLLTEAFENDSSSVESIKYNQLLSKDSTLIEQFMTEALNDEGSTNRSSFEARIRPFFLGSEDQSTSTNQTLPTKKNTSESEIEANLSEFVNADSLAQSLKQSTAKFGTSFISILMGGHFNEKIYQVVTPVVTKSGDIHSVVYFIKTDGSKIVSASYGGKIDGLKQAQSYYQALSASIEGASVKSVDVGQADTSALPQDGQTDESSASSVENSSNEESEDTQASEETVAETSQSSESSE